MARLNGEAVNIESSQVVIKIFCEAVGLSNDWISSHMLHDKLKTRGLELDSEKEEFASLINSMHVRQFIKASFRQAGDSIQPYFSLTPAARPLLRAWLAS